MRLIALFFLSWIGSALPSWTLLSDTSSRHPLVLLRMWKKSIHSSSSMIYRTVSLILFFCNNRIFDQMFDRKQDGRQSRTYVHLIIVFLVLATDFDFWLSVALFVTVHTCTRACTYTLSLSLSLFLTDVLLIIAIFCVHTFFTNRSSLYVIKTKKRKKYSLTQRDLKSRWLIQEIEKH